MAIGPGGTHGAVSANASRSPLYQAAVTGRARCRMHGEARGSGGPRGARNGNFKAWGLDPRERGLAQGHSSQGSGDQRLASSDQSRETVNVGESV